MTAVIMPTTTTECVLPQVVLRLTEDLDISTLPILREHLTDALSLHPDRVIVDLTACRYIDAQAITVLLDAHRSIRKMHGRLVLRGCSPEISRLLALAGVWNVFDTEPAHVVDLT